MDINSICVCGAGTMGRGIAQVCAQSGFHTILYELSPLILSKAKAGIEKDLEILVAKQKLTRNAMESVMKRIQFTGDLQDCLADVFIEAIVERTELKIALFNQLAELNHGECVFATNTSSLSIRDIALEVNHPERLIGMHFFNPATIMQLVEVVCTDYTNLVTRDIILALAKSLRKVPVLCSDSPGFIVNRVARPFYIESLRLVEENKIDPAKLDKIMEVLGFKMGPFRLMDLIGNDINYAVSCSIYKQLDNPIRLRPSFLQERLVEEGKWGRKTGQGYYHYK